MGDVLVADLNQFRFSFRCLALLCPNLSNKMSTGANGKIVIICIWLYANILLIPVYAQVNRAEIHQTLDERQTIMQCTAAVSFLRVAWVWLVTFV